MTEPKEPKDQPVENIFTNVVERDISEEMKSSYIEYSMSVIVGRAPGCA